MSKTPVALATGSGRRLGWGIIPAGDRADGSGILSYAGRVPAAPAPGRPAETDILSAREMEVLQAISKGFTYKEIAADLEISLGTVRTYIQRIYDKLHIHTRAEAVMKFAATVTFWPSVSTLYPTEPVRNPAENG